MPPEPAGHKENQWDVLCLEILWSGEDHGGHSSSKGKEGCYPAQSVVTGEFGSRMAKSSHFSNEAKNVSLYVKHLLSGN